MTGFIGSYVAKALLDRGDSIVAFVRNPDKIPSLCAHPQVQVVVGELQQMHLHEKELLGCDACIHIALGWGETPTTMLENDTLPAVALMEAAAKAGCARFLYTSSTAAMGAMHPVMHEKMRTVPSDLYGATKAATEAYILGFRSPGMRKNIIRPGYTFGNPVVPDGVTQPDARFRSMAKAALSNQPISLIQHDGTQFVHAQDLARLYLAVLDSEADGEVFLGLSQDWISWERIAQYLIAKCASHSAVQREDRGWGQEPCVFSVDKIEQHYSLSFHPWKALENHMDWCVQIAQEKLP